MDNNEPEQATRRLVEPADGDHTGGNDVVIDVRPLIERGEEPFERSWRRWNARRTSPGRRRTLRAGPVAGALSAQGFHHALSRSARPSGGSASEPGATAVRPIRPLHRTRSERVQWPGLADTGTVTGTGTDTDAEAGGVAVHHPSLSTTGHFAPGAARRAARNLAPRRAGRMMAMNPTASVASCAGCSRVHGCGWSGPGSVSEASPA